MRKTFTTVLVIFALVIAILATAFGVALAQGPGTTCAVTGGGTIGDSTVRIGVALKCDVTRAPNILNISWGAGNCFHLDTLTQAICTDDPSISPGRPPCNCDTYEGWGVGRYNAVDGYQARWIFTDAGEPGTTDWAWVKVTDAGGTTVLEQSGFLRFGNLEFRNSR